MTLEQLSFLSPGRSRTRASESGLDGDFVSSAGGVNRPRVAANSPDSRPSQKCAKDGAPTVLVMPARIKSLGRPPAAVTRVYSRTTASLITWLGPTSCQIQRRKKSQS